MPSCRTRIIFWIKRPYKLLSFSLLSLFIFFQPLPESEYNSSPETVGYRLRVSRTDGQGEDRIDDVKGEGRASEATLEGLNPWTQYKVQIQAYNSIGPGPWSNTVGARTAESGMNIDLVSSCTLFANPTELSGQYCISRALEDRWMSIKVLRLPPWACSHPALSLCPPHSPSISVRGRLMEKGRERGRWLR